MGVIRRAHLRADLERAFIATRFYRVIPLPDCTDVDQAESTFKTAIS
jgi:hypothetical protein